MRILYEQPPLEEEEHAGAHERDGEGEDGKGLGSAFTHTFVNGVPPRSP